MGKLEIPDSFTIQLDYESSQYSRNESTTEAEIARILIADHIYDPDTKEYLLNSVEDIVNHHGELYVLINLKYRLRR